MRRLSELAGVAISGRCGVVTMALPHWIAELIVLRTQLSELIAFLGIVDFEINTINAMDFGINAAVGI